MYNKSQLQYTKLNKSIYDCAYSADLSTIYSAHSPHRHTLFLIQYNPAKPQLQTKMQLRIYLYGAIFPIPEINFLIFILYKENSYCIYIYTYILVLYTLHTLPTYTLSSIHILFHSIDSFILVYIHMYALPKLVYMWIYFHSDSQVYLDETKKNIYRYIFRQILEWVRNWEMNNTFSMRAVEIWKLF